MLVVLAIGAMVFAGGTSDWTKLSSLNDPLPQAMKNIVGKNSDWLHMLVWLSLFGLVASFRGIILGSSRQILALAHEACLPAYFAKVHPRFKTPHRAILAGGVVGIVAIYSDEFIRIGGLMLTANIATMAVFGAILMCIISMLRLFRLRRTGPNRRNCISNMRPAGLDYEKAAGRLHCLLTQARPRQLSGVDLKDETLADAALHQFSEKNFLLERSLMPDAVEPPA